MTPIDDMPRESKSRGPSTCLGAKQLTSTGTGLTPKVRRLRVVIRGPSFILGLHQYPPSIVGRIGRSMIHMPAVDDVQP